MNLDDEIALVTGASRGIGAAKRAEIDCVPASLVAVPITVAPAMPKR